MLKPTSFTISLNSFSDRFVRNPGIDSSLSKVPPVCPNPLPEIMGTLQPQAATIGARTKLTLSPTPPVECLSTVFISSGNDILFPESI